MSNPPAVYISMVHSSVPVTREQDLLRKPDETGAMENVADTGPIPTGRYSIGRPHRSARTGPHVMNLTPMGHNAHGRTAFQIHGNNATNNASNGCVILPRNVREQISNSGDADLTVEP